MNRAEPFVVAVVATYRRPAEIAALLASLGERPGPLGAIVVVDNGADEATRLVVEKSAVTAIYHGSASNLGCGGGLHAGEQLALERFGAQMTHLWILDDDTVVAPGALEVLLEAMARTGAVVAHPLTENAEGRLSWFPGLLDPQKFRVVREHPTPEEYLRRCGPAPVPFSWSQGIALLVERQALERAGFHRTDFWVRGEDLEFSLRLTCGQPGLYVPAARVKHLPPAASEQPEVKYVRHAALLQNVAYVGLRLRHGRRIARTIPGNGWRFLQTWGWKPRVLWELIRAVAWGALFGWPAGHTYGRLEPRPDEPATAPAS